MVTITLTHWRITQRFAWLASSRWNAIFDRGEEREQSVEQNYVSPRQSASVLATVEQLSDYNNRHFPNIPGFQGDQNTPSCLACFPSVISCFEPSSNSYISGLSKSINYSNILVPKNSSALLLKRNTFAVRELESMHNPNKFYLVIFYRYLLIVIPTCAKLISVYCRRALILNIFYF